MDVTIITYVQQDDSNTGYVIAKGFDDEMRDWGLLLAYNRIALTYRTDKGPYETITFSGVTVADGRNHSVAAIIDSTNQQAIISVDGDVSTAALNQQPEFRPGVSLHVYHTVGIGMKFNLVAWHIKLILLITHVCTFSI